MTDAHTSTSSITAGMVPGDQMCRDLDCTLPTLRKWERQGLLVLRIGVKRLYDPSKVRAWFEARSSFKGDVA